MEERLVCPESDDDDPKDDLNDAPKEEIGFENVQSYTSFLDEKLKDRGMSRSEFASQMGRARAWATMVLNGARRLQPYLTDRIAEVLDLDESERLELRARVDLSQANTVATRQKAERYLTGLSERKSAEEEGKDVMRHLTKWYIGGVLELARCEKFRADPKWIAATLYPRIDPDEAQFALDVLQQLGFLDEDFALVERKSVGTEAQGPKAILDLHRTNLEHTLESVGAFRFNERHLASGLIAMDDTEFVAFREQVHDAFIAAVYDSGHRCKVPNRLYRATLTIFPASLYTDTDYDPSEID